MRKEYVNSALTRKSLLKTPFEQFDQWFDEAQKKAITEPNAMQLATATKKGIPSCRTVLLKQFNSDGLVFYTNYESRKGRELEENPRAFALFWWKEMERQVSVEGKVEKLPRNTSEEYFSERPLGAQISAWASQQDAVVASRDELDEKYARITEYYEGKAIPLPPYWGGYRLIPHRFEFWQGRKNRLHDRFQYTLDKSHWIIERLSP